MGLTPQQELWNLRYEYYEVWNHNRNVKYGICSKVEIDEFEKKIKHHDLRFEKINIENENWLGSKGLVELVSKSHYTKLVSELFDNIMFSEIKLSIFDKKDDYLFIETTENLDDYHIDFLSKELNADLVTTNGEKNFIVFKLKNYVDDFSYTLSKLI